MKLPDTRKRVLLHSAKPVGTNRLRKKNRERWVEALIAVEKQFQEIHFKQTQQQLQETAQLSGQKTRIIHVFDREGDIAPCLCSVASAGTNWSNSPGGS